MSTYKPLLTRSPLIASALALAITPTVITVLPATGIFILGVAAAAMIAQR